MSGSARLTGTTSHWLKTDASECISAAAAILESEKTLGTRLLALKRQWRRYQIGVLFLVVMTSSLLTLLMKTLIA